MSQKTALWIQVQDLGIELRLSGRYSNHLYTLSHLASPVPFSFCNFLRRSLIVEPRLASSSASSSTSQVLGLPSWAFRWPESVLVFTGKGSST